jgi:hypothetical protein
MTDQNSIGDPAAGGSPQPYGQQQPAAWQQPGGWQQPGPPVGAQGQWFGQPVGHGQPGYGPPPGYGGYPPPQHTNGLAVASLVLGILWIYWLGSILALVFGYIARKQIRERGDSGSGLALAGIVLGWVGLGTLTLLIVFGFAANMSFGP